MTARRVAVFAFDLNEASQIKSIRAIRATGAEVTSFSFRRPNMNPGFRPDWPDVPLGLSVNGVGLRRLAAVLRAALRLARCRGAVAGADLIVARNLDLALLALAARWMAGVRTPVIYQCLDIHGLMTTPGPAGWLARLAERLVLRRCARLVVSAPRFLSAYFEPVQRYDGDSFILENRIWWPGVPPSRPHRRKVPGWPVRLGWVGTLRCPATLHLLAGTAERMGAAVRIVLRGTVHRHQLPDFDDVLAARPNMAFEGPYAYPEGLSAAYADLDCVWAQDLWQRDGNSEWLLANRIYEAGYFGCPALALERTATGAYLRAGGLGLVLPDATPHALAGALTLIGPKGLARLRGRILSLPRALFCLSCDDVAAMLDLSSSQPPARRQHDLAG